MGAREPRAGAGALAARSPGGGAAPSWRPADESELGDGETERDAERGARPGAAASSGEAGAPANARIDRAQFLLYEDTKIKLHFSHFKILEDGRETCFRDAPHQCPEFAAAATGGGGGDNDAAAADHPEL